MVTYAVAPLPLTHTFKFCLASQLLKSDPYFHSNPFRGSRLTSSSLAIYKSDVHSNTIRELNQLNGILQQWLHFTIFFTKRSSVASEQIYI
jgi:hypothetical protein